MFDTHYHYHYCCPRCSGREHGGVCQAIGCAKDVTSPLPPGNVTHERPIPRDVMADILITMETEQEVVVQLNGFKNRRGQPAAIDGEPAWTTDQSDLVDLVVTNGGMACAIRSKTMPTNPNGSGQAVRVQMSADGMPGPEEVRFRQIYQVTINALPAIEVDSTVGTPTDIPPVPAPAPNPA